MSLPKSDFLASRPTYLFFSLAFKQNVLLVRINILVSQVNLKIQLRYLKIRGIGAVEEGRVLLSCFILKNSTMFKVVSHLIDCYPVHKTVPISFI